SGRRLLATSTGQTPRNVSTKLVVHRKGPIHPVQAPLEAHGLSPHGVARGPILGYRKRICTPAGRTAREDEMRSHRFAAVVSGIAAACLASAPASGQGQARGATNYSASKTVPRTPDGRPDLQGFWTTQTFTPLQRPDYLAGKEFFTE